MRLCKWLSIVIRGLVMNPNEDAAYEIKKKQYCSNGDHQGWLVECYDRKAREGRKDQITDDEYQAKLAEDNSFKQSLEVSANVGF